MQERMKTIIAQNKLTLRFSGRWILVRVISKQCSLMLDWMYVCYFTLMV